MAKESEARAGTAAPGVGPHMEVKSAVLGFLGEFNAKWEGHLSEINGRELFTLVPLGAIVVFLGVFPTAVLDLMASTLDHLNGLVLKSL